MTAVGKLLRGLSRISLKLGAGFVESLCRLADASRTPLTFAIFRARGDRAIELLNGGADPDSETWQGYAALTLAAETGDIRIVEAILSRAKRIAPGDGAPLSLALQKGQTKVTRLLLERYEKAECLDLHPGLLYVAVESRDEPTARFLLGRGADPEHGLYRGGDSPLQAAARHGDLKLTRLLLENGAAPDLATGYGWTALAMAAERGHIDVVQELLSRGASAKAATFNGTTPLMRASENGHAEVVRELLAHGADKEQRNSHGEDATSIVKRVGDTSIVDNLKSDPKGADRSSLDD